MKKLIALFIAGVSFIVTQGQIDFGAKAGLNLSTLSGNDASGAKLKAGFHAGILVGIHITDMLSVQPELQYSGQGAKFNENGASGSLNLNYLNIPLLAKYTHSSGLFGETGPQFGLRLSAKAKSGGTTVDEKDNYKSTDFGWVFGIGYLSTANVGIDIRYLLGLANIEKNGTGGYSYTQKNGVIQIGIFYLFLRSSKN